MDSESQQGRLAYGDRSREHPFQEDYGGEKRRFLHLREQYITTKSDTKEAERVSGRECP